MIDADKKKTFEEKWKQEEVLSEKYTKLHSCIERGLRIRKDFVVQNVKDEDMTFTISEEENNLIKDIYAVFGDMPSNMLLGMKISVGNQRIAI